ncbi:unnamed protein product [Arctia plantaginis]|uniref:Uncharacterized protein n=1 Tax=Arctia plantaginis TaxID=874455 RepID=A0A8S1BE80_ARCPL|nr:unnamed protein product [Arctia plantaginis]
MQVRMHKLSDLIPYHKDTISTKLFTCVFLEDIMKALDWEEKSRNMSQLRFVVNLILVAESAAELQIMLVQLHEASLSVASG